MEISPHDDLLHVRSLEAAGTTAAAIQRRYDITLRASIHTERNLHIGGVWLTLFPHLSDMLVAPTLPQGRVSAALHNPFDRHPQLCVCVAYLCSSFWPKIVLLYREA